MSVATFINKKAKAGNANKWGITPQDAKNISRYMLAEQLSWQTIYMQACGDRNITPIVLSAIESYFDLKVSATTTHDEIMQSGYKRWAEHGFENAIAIREEVMNQENPAASAWDGVDLTAEQAAENRESVKRVFR